MNPESPENQFPAAQPVTLPAKRRYIPNLSATLFALFVIFVLAALLVPDRSYLAHMGKQTQALARAKQVGLALKLFAGDHDGVYPAKGAPVEMTGMPLTSNAAFAPLFPTYVASETIFGNSLSAYQTREPDNRIDARYTGTPVKTLEPGENVWAYVAGVTEAGSADTPLVMDGTDGSLYYGDNRALRGGVWEGKKAIVAYLDNHAAVEHLEGRANTRYLRATVPGRPANLLDVSWIGHEARLLNPAVAP